MLITHTLLVFYTPRHNPNYAANDSVWKAQNKYIPARKVKKDKLQMNQNSNSQGNLVVLLIPYFFSTKNRMFVQRGFNLHSRRHSSGVESSPLDTLHSAKPTASPLPPPPRTDGFSALVCYPNTYSVSHPNAKRPFTDSSPFLK